MLTEIDQAVVDAFIETKSAEKQRVTLIGDLRDDLPLPAPTPRKRGPNKTGFSLATNLRAMEVGHSLAAAGTALRIKQAAQRVQKATGYKFVVAPDPMQRAPFRIWRAA